MGKLDTIFLRIIQDEQFADAIGNDALRIRDINDGKKSFNKNIKAVAECLDQLNKKIETSRSEMRLKGISGNIIIDESEYQAIYRKIVSLLSK